VVDVHYPDAGGARGAAVVCSDSGFGSVVGEHVVELAEVAPYEPGRFYLRELPVLRAVLAAIDDLELLVVDGYVDLAPGRPGLGAHCHEAFGVPVIGIAKTPFRGATHAAEVRRGTATRPLHVTAAGLAQEDAVRIVTAMSGPYRLPDAVRRADALARGRSVQR
jgi:deoxyribonuclease V